MSRPTFLSGTPATVKVNGIDIKDYGILINTINWDNPAPVTIEDTLPGRNGSIDSTNKLSSIDLNISGTISGNSNSDLLANINSFKTLFRIREEADLFKIELQNVTNYVYNGRLQSLTITPISTWFITRAADFNLVIRCPDPYKTSTTATSSTGSTNIGKLVQITYAGTIETPLSIEIKGKSSTNLLYGVSESSSGWTGTNATVSDDTGLHPSFPVIYGTTQIMVVQTAGADYLAYMDILAKVNTAKYYCISVYIRIMSGSVPAGTRIEIYTDLSGGTTYLGNIITSNACLGRSFVKIRGSDFIGASTIYLQVCSVETAGTLLFDGVCMNEITSAEYADASYVPMPYTDYSGAAVKTVTPIIKVLGKNICPLGKKDCDYSALVYSKATMIYDQDIVRNILVSIGSTTYRYMRSQHFRVDAGSYKLTFKYKGTTSGSVYIQVLAIGENTGAQIAGGFYEGNEEDGIIHSAALSSVDSTWRFYSSTVTIPADIPYISIRWYDNGGTPWKELRIAEVQLELGTSATNFEYYSEQQFKFSDQIADTDLVLIDGEYKSVVKLDDTAHTASNKISAVTGQFLALRPGVNTILLYDYGSTTPSQEKYISRMYDFVLKYRTRYI